MQKIVNKTWGYELWIENNDLYCGKHLHVIPEKWCSVHYHKNKKETFYVINGELLIQLWYNCHIEHFDVNEKFTNVILKKGQSLTIDTMTPHRFTSALDYSCDFIEISTHHDDNDSYRLVQSI